MPTRSYKKFIKNIETVTRLKDTYYETCSHRGTRGRAAYDHITRSAIIFMASAFEVYVEDVIKECCECLMIQVNILLTVNIKKLRGTKLKDVQS